MTRSPAALTTVLAWLPTARTLPRVAPLALACAALGLMGLTFASRLPQEPADPFSVRLAVLLAGLMVVWAFEDPAQATVDPTPIGRARLRAVRATTSAAAWACVVTIVLVMAGAEHASGRYALEAATVMTWALTMSAAAARSGEAESGRLAAGAIIAMMATTLVLPVRDLLWGPPDVADPRGIAWWSTLLAAGVVAATVAALEPWPVRRLPRWGGRHHRAVPAGEPSNATEATRSGPRWVR